METVKKEWIETKTETAALGYFDEELDDFVIIVDNPCAYTDKRVYTSFECAAETLGVSPALLRAIANSFDWLRDAVMEDLQDIWKRLDQVERKIGLNAG